MLDINKPVQTRDGKPARILCTDKKGNLPILALFGEDDRVGVYTMYGDFAENLGLEHPLDLINVPEKHVRYINVNSNQGNSVVEQCCMIGGTYATSDEANEWKTAARIACIRVEFKEGQFDE